MEQSSFFNSVNGDRQYDQEFFALYFKQFLSTGLYHSDNVPALHVTAVTGLQSKMTAGSAFLEGYMYTNDEQIIFNHDIGNATNPRIDRIILRLDRSVGARYIRAFIKKGTPATIPAPPVLQRDEIVYEVSLAQVRVDAGANTIKSVTDERLNTSVAGLVHSLISIPTDQFVAEWDNWFSKTVDWEADWNQWRADRQNEVGVRLLTGAAEPTGTAAGDVWFKEL